VQAVPVTVEDPSGVKLTFPASTFKDQFKVLIGKVDKAPDLPDSTAKRIIGSIYYFGPDGIVFDKPITVVIPFPIADLKRLGVKTKEAIKVFTYTTAGKEWVEIPNVIVDDVKGTVTFFVNHFSYFRISAETPRIAPGQIINYPNPFNPEGTGEERTTAIKYMLPNKTTVSLKIYDVSSTLVREFTAADGLEVNAEAETGYIVSWDGKNGKGDIVANNVYFCVLSTKSGKVYVRKIVVLR